MKNYNHGKDELSKITHELHSGIAKDSIQKSVGGKYVAPGISGTTYLRMLRFYGLLDEDKAVVRLKTG